MNIKLSYLYRDTGNHKNFGEVVFCNRNNLTLAQIEPVIMSALIEQQWFYASKWQVPDLHFTTWNDDVDHTWHEFESIEETDQPACNGDISDFLARIE